MKSRTLFLLLGLLLAGTAARTAEQFAAGSDSSASGARPALVPTDPALIGAPYRNPQTPLEDRVADLFARLTPQEKAALVHGSSGMGYGHIPRIGLPEILMTDGPQGVRRDSGTATAMPCGLALAATWNPALVEQGGTVLGEECRALNFRVFLAPGVNLMRTPLGGRDFEYMGEDPVLAGKTAAAYIRGVQSQGVAACVKHWNGNEQEHWRTTINVEMDDRALQELYAPAFELAVREGQVWAVMPAYNRFRGDYACASKTLNHDLLDTQFGYDGALISDWGAWHDDKASLEGGCTLEMPADQDAKRDRRLVARVEQGEISSSAVDEAVRRNLRLLFRVGAFDAWQGGSLNTAGHQQTARAAEAEAMVLLKNDRAFLPLDAAKLHKIAVIGPNADQYQTMADGAGLALRGGSGATRPPYEITPLAALQKRFGDRISYAPGIEFEPGKDLPIPASAFPDGLKAEFFTSTECSGTAVASRQDGRVDFRFNPGSPLPKAVNPDSFSARWSGRLVAPRKADYVISLASDDGSRLRVDGRVVIDNWGDHDVAVKSATVSLDPAQPVQLQVEYANTAGKGLVSLRWREQAAAVDPVAQALAAAKDADVVLFFGGTDHRYDREALGWGDVKNADKPDLELIGPQADLIRKLAAINPNIAVVLINGSPVSVEQWHDRVPAILEAWYGGMEAGDAIADVLCGDANPSGKLPCTFGRKLADWRAHALGTNAFPGTGNNGVVTYLDGIWVGYRWFDQAKLEPRYPFGFGLSYTTFELGQPELSAGELHPDGQLTVKVPVKNTGSRAGAEVVQLYVANPGASVPRPPKELKGFQKVFLQPGESKLATFTIRPRDFSYWDVAGHAWKADAGTFEILTGDSSRHLTGKAECKFE